MLKRTRSKSTPRSGGKIFSSSTMNSGNAHVGDRKRTCAFTNESCEILNELRQTNLLCDARITTKDRASEYPVHRFVLAGKTFLQFSTSMIVLQSF